MEERKYFDYELAYKGYLDFKRKFENESKDIITTIKKNNYDTTPILQLIDEDSIISVHLFDYNCSVEVVYNNDSMQWELTPYLSLLSYSSCEDNLEILDNKDEMVAQINDKIIELNHWAKSTDYTDKDIKEELESLDKLKDMIIKGEN